ncbi:MAG: zf-HC2 domain-containing protein [Lachnospiraceae bacterium]|nr:zf-HC2 domain-containing protein [Lachnospiraceae bacterium]
MECNKALSMIPQYIDQSLSDYELQKFLEHIDHCPECYDELEIAYMMTVAMNRLDHEDNASYDLSAAMKNSLKQAHEYSGRLTMLKIIRYSVCTLAFYGVLVTLFLQVRMWFGL